MGRPIQSVQRNLSSRFSARSTFVLSVKYRVWFRVGSDTFTRYTHTHKIFVLVYLYHPSNSITQKNTKCLQSRELDRGECPSTGSGLYPSGGEWAPPALPKIREFLTPTPLPLAYRTLSALANKVLSRPGIP